MISARFQVYAITHTGTHADVVLRAGASNVAWSKYTPNGEIRMSLTAPSAISFFVERIGKEVDILLGVAGALPGHPEFQSTPNDGPVSTSDLERFVPGSDVDVTIAPAARAQA